jgi:hypothetical protein
MSWSGILSYQTISFTNLKDAVDTGVFPSKATITPSDEQVTVQDVLTYTYATVTGDRPTNNVPVKSSLSKQAYLVRISGNGTTSTLACSTLVATEVAYIDTPSPAFGTIFYADDTLTTIYDMTSYTNLFIKFYNSVDGLYYRCRVDLTTSTINNTPFACTSTPDPIPPTPAPYPYEIWGAKDDYASVSQDGGLGFTGYSGLSTSDYINTVGASDDGIYVCVGKNVSPTTTNGRLYVSNDSGSSWSTVDLMSLVSGSFSNINYWKVAVSSSGQYMMATVTATQSGAGNVYFFNSSNYGATWSYINSYGVNGAGGCGMSANGTYQTFAFRHSNGNSYRYYSSNSGSTFTLSSASPETYFTDIRMSSTGTYQILSGNNGSTAGGRIFVSSNSGSSWTERFYDSANGMKYVAMSDDGHYQVGMGGNGKYYISTDYGSTFSTTGFVYGGDIAGIALSVSGYGTTPYLVALSYTQAFVYYSIYPFLMWNQVAIPNVNAWNFIQSRAIHL